MTADNTAVYSGACRENDRNDTAVDKNYLYYLLLSDTEQIKRSGHGLAMIHVTKAGMERRPFPLPPLAEQKRIVAKLEQLLPLCERLAIKTRA